MNLTVKASVLLYLMLLNVAIPPTVVAVSVPDKVPTPVTFETVTVVPSTTSFVFASLTFTVTEVKGESTDVPTSAPLVTESVAAAPGVTVRLVVSSVIAPFAPCT